MEEDPVIFKQASSAYSYQLFAGGKEDGEPEGFLASEPSVWDDIEAEGPLQPKTWSHLALAYDGGSLRLYVNGELANLTESSPPAQASVGPLLIGANQDGEDFKGRIDEVRIYDRALEGGEATDITRLSFNRAFFADAETHEAQTTVRITSVSMPSGFLGVAFQESRERSGRVSCMWDPTKAMRSVIVVARCSTAPHTRKPSQSLSLMTVYQAATILLLRRITSPHQMW